MAMKTLSEIAAENLADRATIIDLALKASPELRLVPVKPIKGTEFRVRVGTANPTAAFRADGDGVAYSHSATTVETVSCKISNTRYSIDKAVADASEDGWEMELAREGKKQLSAVFQLLGKQFYYGNASPGDTAGHPGLIQAIDSAMSLDAGGAAGADGSSVWAVKFGEDGEGVFWIMGRNGEIEVSEPRIETITGANAQPLTGYVQEILTRIGLCTENTKAVGRLHSLTAAVTLTDDMLSDLVSEFDSAYGAPDAIFMSRRSRKQLQKSRTATTATGAAVPTPIDHDGINIVVTENILNTETIAA